MKNKNRFKLFGFAVIVMAIVFNFTVCSSGGAGGGAAPIPSVQPDGPTSTKYESKDNEGNTFILEITKASGRAAYTPQNGDNYVLTIILTTGETKKSSGTIAVSVSGNSNNFELTPKNSETTFIVTIVETNTGAQLMTAITGTIVTDKGDVTPPAVINPVREYETFGFGANKWHLDEYESWSNDISLSDFTTKIPKTSDVIKVRISGKTSKPFKGFGLDLACHTKNWEEFKRLGGVHGYTELSGTFDRTFQFTVENDPLPDSRIYLGFVNMLWNAADKFDTGERLPAEAQNGDLMATINNFKISLISQ